MVAKRPTQSEFDRRVNPPASFFGIPAVPRRSLAMRKVLIRARLRGEEGQSLIEAAFSMMVLLMTVLGIMDMAMALYSYDFVADAAREGARYAIVHGSACTGCVATSSSIQTYVQNMGLVGIKPSDLTVTATWPDTGSLCTPSLNPCNNQGNNVKVTVNYVFHLGIPLVPSSTLNLSSTSESIISR
jgi:Flp pilus assembly protein TadG